ncbi:DUF418 domain-containing protein, partial [bacterium]|nr:DUF418 domain-containing protein [bacterium]
MTSRQVPLSYRYEMLLSGYMMLGSMQPALKEERYKILDVVRGFALPGIIVANMVLYSLYLNLPAEKAQSLATHSSDKLFDFLELFIIEGKFYTIFSVLFGIGFSILLTRASRKGLIFYRFFLRRVFFLYLIGLAHAFLFWPNDILTFYAICGALLLLVTRMSNRALLMLATIILLSPIAIHLAGGFHPKIFVEIRDSLYQRFGFTKGTVVATYTTGSYGQVVLLNFSRWFSQLNYVTSSGMMISIFGKFLLGFLIGRNEIHTKLHSYSSIIRKLMLFGFAIGLPLNFLYAKTFYDESIITTVTYVIGFIPLSMAYVCTICLLWMDPKWQNRLLIFAPVGRMALTN